jgi:cell fate regulator YaaT (PSP1 superfamily)
MAKVVGIRFKKAGKIYYFDPDNLEMQVGDHAIVETARGVEYGSVVIANREVEEGLIVQPLKKVIRAATEDDTQQEGINKEKEKEAFQICVDKIKDHKLDMKLIDVEVTFDNNKMIFYFTAEGRVDFRELVKDLASIFRTRIELRQIGVRDEAKMLNGIGICGRPLCCATFLGEFQPVSIKMAKEQNLSLNPTKISGICGRLFCCLKYEEETYEELNKNLPDVGSQVKTPDGMGEVISVNIIRQLVRALVKKKDSDEREVKIYSADELEILMPKKRKDDDIVIRVPKGKVDEEYEVKILKEKFKNE